MRLSSRTKHLLHCASFLTIIFTHHHIERQFFSLLWNSEDNQPITDPVKDYGHFLAWFLYSLRFIGLLSMLSLLPLILSISLGLTLYNSFPDQVKLKMLPKQAPFICFRTVTRGDYLKLVKKNVSRNLNTCLNVGLENFVIEVVTKKPIGVSKHRLVREVIVPDTYETKNKTLYKSRQLQYCLDYCPNNFLGGDDWIVHLDEDTIVTEDSIKGIINFVSEGKHPIGQGAVIVNQEVVSWLTAFACCPETGSLFALNQFIARLFHRPMFGLKGSFLVVKSSVERAISFDHGTRSSICEDTFFAMTADMLGYSYDFIDGPMLEQPATTISDYLEQRKRYVRGGWLTVSATQLAWRSKWLYALTFFGWIMTGLSPLQFVLNVFYPIPNDWLFDLLSNGVCNFFVYLYIFGFVRVFSLERLGVRQYLLKLISLISNIRFISVLNFTAFSMGIFSRTNDFVVVKKKQ